jgi:protein-S-isoprenylcysteine O-methyltransferase Ste14
MNQTNQASIRSRTVLLMSEKLIHYRPPRVSMLLLVLATITQWVLPPVGLVLFRSPVLAICAATAGFTFMIWAWWLFKQAETAICPTADNRVLVTSGIYRLTRNPMYLGIILMMTGMALWFGTLPYYLVVVVYTLIINQVFCPHEEVKLIATFGEEYSNYQGKVRRWL